MRQVPLTVVFILLIAGQVSAQDQIFSDDFEWGSICAWSNLWYPDNDTDEWGANGVAGISVSCPAPAGYVTVRGDCNDYDEFVFPGAWEGCDFIDNDCDLSTEDGSDDLWLGDLCDGTDSDLCSEGVFDCLSGTQVCEDTTGNTPDLCDGSDDDCNPATPDGADETWLSDPCDGADSDLCVEGTFACAGGSQTCSDNSSSSLDLCNGADDDCDPSSADGEEDPLSGASCDGPDSDLCLEGINSCVGGSLQCSDQTGDIQDVCNGIDDDCDPASSDGDEDPQLGAACDGPDSDLCLEGTSSCNGGALTCSDNSSNSIDLCNGADDDCDPASADGSEDPLLGAACDGLDSDLCLEGVYSCSGGSLVCSDATGSTTEVCNGIDDDCDGVVDDGFIRDDNPLCSGSLYNLGSVRGDVSSEVLSDSWYNEEWLSFTVTEDNDGAVYLSASIELISPPGTDFDLYVYCDNCDGSLAGSSVNGPGEVDGVTVRRDDSWGADDTFYVIVEVRHYSSTLCANWTLTVQGNTTASSESCPSP